MTVPTEADMERRTPLENAQWNERVYRDRATARAFHLACVYSLLIGIVLGYLSRFI